MLNDSSRKSFLIFFVLWAFLELLAAYFHSELRFVTKPGIMMALIIYYLKFSEERSLIFCLGLVFGLLGDILLLGESDMSFQLGLASFLVMQLIYAYSFYRHCNLVPRKQGAWIIMAIMYASFLGYFLVIHVSSALKVPIMLYALSVSLMLITSIIIKKTKEGLFIIIGAIFFVLSDSLLGIDKFITSLPYSAISIMGTYIFAQFMIVVGMTDILKDTALYKN